MSEKQSDSIIKLLLVDDDEDDYIMTRDLLREIEHVSYHLDWVDSFDQALEQTELQKHDVYLFDYRLGAHSGLELLQRAVRHGCRVPIILLTGQGDHEIDVKAMKAGAADYLIKGQIDPALLERSIRHAIERRQSEAERERLQQELFQTQKLDSIGMLAGGIAHDFNNLLQIILGYVQKMKVHMDNDDRYCEDLNLIEVAADKAAVLTNQLLSYARKGKYVVESLNLSQVVEEVVLLLERTVPENITINTDLSYSATRIKADKNQIYQMLLNLCVNAKDAMPNGGTITISSESRTVEEQYCTSSNPEACPGKYIRLSIQDTGIGITDEVRAKMFEPFFTTKSMGRGTGLGLAMVYGIVKHHGGFIEVDTVVGRGAKFKIYLPAIVLHENAPSDQETAQPSTSQQLQAAPESREKRILVVDDEEVVRFLAIDLLENLGYEPIPAEDGEQAVEIYKKQKNDIDLVLLDMIMPKLGGVETFRELRKINPEVPIVLLSGYTKDVAAQELLNQGARGFLQKPYKIDELAQVVETISNSLRLLFDHVHQHFQMLLLLLHKPPERLLAFRIFRIVAQLAIEHDRILLNPNPDI